VTNFCSVNNCMNRTVSHSRSDESIDAKAKWFKSLSMKQRMDVFVAFTNLILKNNPEIAKKKHDRPASDRIRVLSKE
jgi:hypothetical protein